MAIRTYLRVVKGETVTISGHHPLAVGLFQFSSVMSRDRVVQNSHSEFNGPSTLAFINEDDARNARIIQDPFECWVLLLGLPQRLIRQSCIWKIVNTFGILLNWHDPRDSRLTRF